jgi:hypothetical protein
MNSGPAAPGRAQGAWRRAEGDGTQSPCPKLCFEADKHFSAGKALRPPFLRPSLIPPKFGVRLVLLASTRPPMRPILPAPT